MFRLRYFHIARLPWLLFLGVLFFLKLPAQSFRPQEISRWQKQAAAVTIIRDHFGIPHIYGKKDADAVFGILYAQCEDDFKRVEENYLEKLGRLSEIHGPSHLYNDLLIRLVIDTADAIRDYQTAPIWLKSLLQAYADGINYYLYTHPAVHPALLQRFEPWFPLLWTDGSIGAIDVAGISVREIQQFYDPANSTAMVYEPLKYVDPLPGGSNGFAIAPVKTADGHAMLYINPHVTFYFRPEVAMQSEEGLHAYGAVTWGQFFIYQGFNEHCGWMHTSSYSDVADAYLETVRNKNGQWEYAYNGQWKPIRKKDIRIRYLNNGVLQSKTFTAYYTHHGPVMSSKGDKWISVRANNRDIKGLIQSWERTKANNLAEFTQTMALLANTSNNTVYADDKGNIAYWHGNFMPKRDPSIDWSKPVDGSSSATEWQGLHPLKDLIQVHNPATGFIQNCNSTPFTVSGSSSPKASDFPAYMAPIGENFRGINAVQLLSSRSGFTLDKLIATGYDTHLAAFDVLLPPLLKAYESGKQDPAYQSLASPINLLVHWDHASARNSVATTLAVYWAEKIWPAIIRSNAAGPHADQVEKTKYFAEHASPKQLLDPLLAAVNQLQAAFGTWEIAWGKINRYQRLTGKIEEQYDDDQPSLPCGFAASTWGCIPSFVSRPMPGTKLRYGYNGNSFIAAIDFGKKITAKSLLAGGNSGDPASPHFGDQAEMYTMGIFKDVLFYKTDVEAHAEKTYHPGEAKGN
ncbi:MAG TPA: penicillin acylase family protein [Sediminibacterium sp.]|nr:penicillin acylase family protein [Sediminibacterium sp.]